MAHSHIESRIGESKSNVYLTSVRLREEKESFINKKFNKLMKDREYGTMQEMNGKIRK